MPAVMTGPEFTGDVGSSVGAEAYAGCRRAAARVERGLRERAGGCVTR
jgi:hypothetical protein